MVWRIHADISSRRRKGYEPDYRPRVRCGRLLCGWKTLNIKVIIFIFLILGQNGTIISGEYPEEFTVEVPVELAKTQTIKWEREQYLIKDVRIKNAGKELYVLRGVVKKEDIYSSYKSIENISYLSILVVFFVITASGVVLFRQISRIIKNMCQSIENIGQNADISQRLEEDDRIYEIRVLAQANNRMLDRLEQTFWQQEQFTSDVAHELRTPIAVIMAQYQCVRGENATREDLAEALEVIHRQSAKIEKIIIQLLNFSRLEQGRMQLGKEEIDLVEIVQSVCEEQQEKAEEEIKIDMCLSPAFCRKKKIKKENNLVLYRRGEYGNLSVLPSRFRAGISAPE